MTKKNKAVEIFGDGFCCSQSVLQVFAEEFELDKNIALKLADAFGGGIGGRAEICGAVSGAIMVLGLKYGRDNSENYESKQFMRDRINELISEFIVRNNTIVCKKLLNCDISTEKGHAFANENKLFDTLCTKYIADAVEITEELI